MRSCVKAATAVCLVVNVLASYHDHVSGQAVLRTDDVLKTPYSVVFNTNDTSISSPVQTLRGIAIDVTANAVVSSTKDNGGLDTAAWNAATDKACIDALSVLPRSSNPSGNCVCYNLPSLDVTTGIFEADLRLYRVSDPKDNFTSVSPESVKVGLQYHGASVSPISEEELVGMGLVKNQTRGPNRRQDTTASPRLVQTYLFVGRIDADRLAQNMTLAALEQVLMPTLTLSATTPRGAHIQTNMSLNEASFVTGVFSNSLILSDFAAAQAAVSAQLDGLHNGTVAFVLPGVQLMIFPTGAIIVSVWLALGLAAVGLGTWERVRYADMYRRGMTRTRR
ncbi:hypothetical protein E4U42_007859 [Claviceps africana]|uniref:Uncharacterized protein n=1 Tax=Claviceps africana TaxID=83212 RepID=A0A8K0NEX7_9HYPO|nr:hypothetical protein E4U42_007859 [Claviceps africana]